MQFTIDLLQKAYKKLKCSIYFDKTQVLNRRKLIEFEQGDVEAEFEKLGYAFGDQEAWQKLEEEILETVGYWVFPKKLRPKDKNAVKADGKEDGKRKSAVLITNMVPKETYVNEVQYFIDMDIRGHILGVLWLLLVGWRLDKMEYQHSYGNRMNRHLCEELDKGGTVSASPYLFEPYFAQYESWRDEGLNLAKSKINSNQDVVALTMDFKSFFYSLDMNESVQEEMLELLKKEREKSERELKKATDESSQREISDRLSNFVFRVIDKYSKLFGQRFEGRRILPIGFLPSNVLANWSLYKFDKAVVDGWNPLYYGRYVDDIIIVDKVEKNSDLYTKAREELLDPDEILRFYFTQCTRWKGMGNDGRCSSDYALFKQNGKGEKRSENELENDLSTDLQEISDGRTPEQKLSTCGADSSEDDMYYVNDKYFIAKDSQCHIGLQNEKVKLFYFKNGETDALLTCFRNQIAKNASEFRFLPEDEAAFDRDDYTSIYNFNTQDSPNKFRNMDEVSVDKFELSKFLGKFQRICGLVDDRRESRFIADILKIFDIHTLIGNYTVWEKILTILAGNEEWKVLGQVIEQMVKAIQTVRVQRNGDLEEIVETRENVEVLCSTPDDKDLTGKMQETLRQYLVEAWIRSLTLSWGPKVKAHIEKMYMMAQKYELSSIEYDSLVGRRRAYLSTRMYDKYAVPVLLDVFDEEWVKGLDDNQCISLRKLNAIMGVLPEQANAQKLCDWYAYYPFMVTQYDIYTINVLLQMASKNSGKSVETRKNAETCEQEKIEELNLPVRNLEDTEKVYILINYKIKTEDIWAEDKHIMDYYSEKLGANVICVGEDIAEGVPRAAGAFADVGSHQKDGLKDSLRIAVANTCLDHNNLQLLMKGTPNRSYARYSAAVQIINQAICEKADLLVLPELFLPFEWLAVVARTCAKNQMALVTGLEYIVYEDKQKDMRWVYNYTAVILPYLDHGIPSAALSMHLKNHYAPIEQEEIRGYRGIEPAGVGYELYGWRGIWFPVYCCYELASIQDRAKFLSYADLIVAVEWNKDINYYSNIIESLTRDAHCYCVQVNTADYGDSRLMYPGKTESKDIIRTKGGCNETVLVDNVDIKGLREFQFQEYNLQQKNKHFKPTPPLFDREVVLAKMQGRLQSLIQERDNEAKNSRSDDRNKKEERSR